MNGQFLGGLCVGLSAVLSAYGADDAVPPIGPPRVPDSLGVNIHFTHPRPGETPMLAAADFRWIRMDFGWNGSEREKGRYDFSAYDDLLAALAPHHIRALWILDYSNRFYDRELSPQSEEGRRAFARWAAAAVRHFRGQGVLWEMYNEPNIGFWKPRPDVHQYVKLALEVGKAIRAAEPRELYCGPGTSQIDLPFIEECFKAGLLQYWSAVTVHPYRQTGPETVTPEYHQLRRLIARYGPPGKAIPIISSEWGYSSAWHKMDAARQGKMLPRQWLINLANDIPLSIWYDWHDDGQDPKEPEHHFGTVEHSFHAQREPVYDPKPAYRAAQTLARVLGGCRYNKRLDVGNPDDYVFLLVKGDGDLRLAAWTTSATAHAIVIPASSGLFKVIAATGEAQGPRVADGQGLRVVDSDAPQYLVPQSPNPLLEIAASWSRAPLQCDVSGPAAPRFETAIENPLDHAIRVQGRPNTAVEVQPREAVEIPPHGRGTIRFRWQSGRIEGPTAVRFEIQVEGMGTLAQQSQVTITNPLFATVLPASGQRLPIRLENPSGEAFEGQVELIDLEGLQPERRKVAVRMTAGQEETIVPFSLQSAPAGHYRLGLRIVDPQGAAQLRMPAAAMTAVDDFGRVTAETLPGAYRLRPEGDAKVGSEQALQVAGPAEGPPQAGVASLKITYAFAQGWKFLLLQPVGGGRGRIEGRPKAFGLWVYGDGSGNLLRLRFADATGQTFQPHGDAMHWKGWRYVVFRLDGTQAEHWGGANDGQLHYPIRWDALLLIDSAGHHQTQGQIYIGSPTLIE